MPNSEIDTHFVAGQVHALIVAVAFIADRLPKGDPALLEAFDRATQVGLATIENVPAEEPIVLAFQQTMAQLRMALEPRD